MPYPDNNFSLDALIDASMKHPLYWMIDSARKKNVAQILPVDHNIIDTICSPSITIILWSVDYLHRIFIQQYPELNPLPCPTIHGQAMCNPSNDKASQTFAFIESSLDRMKPTERIYLELPCSQPLSTYIEVIRTFKTKPCYELIMYPVLQRELPQSSCVKKVCSPNAHKWTQAKLSALYLIEATWKLETEVLIEMLVPEPWRSLLNDPTTDAQIQRIRHLIGNAQDNITPTDDERAILTATVLNTYIVFREKIKAQQKTNKDLMWH